MAPTGSICPERWHWCGLCCLVPAPSWMLLTQHLGRPCLSSWCRRRAGATYQDGTTARHPRTKSAASVCSTILRQQQHRCCQSHRAAGSRQAPEYATTRFKPCSHPLTSSHDPVPQQLWLYRQPHRHDSSWKATSLAPRYLLSACPWQPQVSSASPQDAARCLCQAGREAAPSRRAESHAPWPLGHKRRLACDKAR